MTQSWGRKGLGRVYSSLLTASRIEHCLSVVTLFYHRRVNRTGLGGGEGGRGAREGRMGEEGCRGGEKKEGEGRKRGSRVMAGRCQSHGAAKVSYVPLLFVYVIKAMPFL